MSVNSLQYSIYKGAVFGALQFLQKPHFYNGKQKGFCRILQMKAES
jgi:hypothetical protein